MRGIHEALLGILLLMTAAPAPAQSKAEVVDHLGLVHVSGSKPILGSNGDKEGIMFKTGSLGTWKDVLFTANLDTAIPDEQKKTLSNYQTSKTAYVTCGAVTIIRFVGKKTSLMAKGDHCVIDRITMQ